MGVSRKSVIPLQTAESSRFVPQAREVSQAQHALDVIDSLEDHQGSKPRRGLGSLPHPRTATMKPRDCTPVPCAWTAWTGHALSGAGYISDRPPPMVQGDCWFPGLRPKPMLLKGSGPFRRMPSPQHGMRGGSADCRAELTSASLGSYSPWTCLAFSLRPGLDGVPTSTAPSFPKTTLCLVCGLRRWQLAVWDWWLQVSTLAPAPAPEKTPLGTRIYQVSNSVG